MNIENIRQLVFRHGTHKEIRQQDRTQYNPHTTQRIVLKNQSSQARVIFMIKNNTFGSNKANDTHHTAHEMST